MPTRRCTDADRRGRLAKARQFLDAADLVETLADEDDLLDALVTMCVHAGIAAGDVICCARLGEHATGQNHTEAVELLAMVDKITARRPVEPPRHEDPRRLQLDADLGGQRPFRAPRSHAIGGRSRLVVSLGSVAARPLDRPAVSVPCGTAMARHQV